MAINEKWHKGYPMPKNPSLEERIKWHLEHKKHCACRHIPEKLLIKIKEMKGKKK